MTLYPFFLFVHILGAFVYFLLHGAVASVTFALQRENDPERAQAYEGILDVVYRGAIPALWVTLGSGVILGFMGAWWGRGWIWASLGVFALVWVLMVRLGNPYVGRQFERIYSSHSLSEEGAKPDANIERLVGARVWLDAQMPLVLSAIGILGLVLILWLMMFKPF